MKTKSYKGGYPSNWLSIRKTVIDRDNYRCRICANSESSLEVHHIDYTPSNNSDENLVTLCGVCHRGVHAERYKPWEHEDWPIPWGSNSSAYYDPP